MIDLEGGDPGEAGLRRVRSASRYGSGR